MMNGAAVFRAHYWDCISLQQDGVQLLPVWLVKAQHELHNPSVSTNNNAVSTSKHGWVGIDTLYLGHTVNYTIPPVSYSRESESERERERERRALFSWQEGRCAFSLTLALKHLWRVVGVVLPQHFAAADSTERRLCCDHGADLQGCFPLRIVLERPFRPCRKVLEVTASLHLKTSRTSMLQLQTDQHKNEHLAGVGQWRGALSLLGGAGRS